MLTATTSTRSNRSIFVPRDTGSPNDGLLKHISNLDSIARLDFERCSVAGDVIYAIEGDAMPTSQQDEEARVGTLAYALKKLNPTDVRPTAVASDSASTVRAFGKVPHESRAYREYLKRLNEIDRQLLNDAVDRRRQHRNETTAGERRDPLPIKEARALLPVEEWTEVCQRARNRAWYQFAPENAFASEPDEMALRLTLVIMFGFARLWRENSGAGIDVFWWFGRVGIIFALMGTGPTIISTLDTIGQEIAWGGSGGSNSGVLYRFYSNQWSLRLRESITSSKPSRTICLSYFHC